MTLSREEAEKATGWTFLPLVIEHPSFGRLDTYLWSNGEVLDPLTGWTVPIERLEDNGWTVSGHRKADYILVGSK